MHSIGIALVLSASIDGKYCDFGRTPNSDDFYEKLKNFMNKYHCMPHPMISASNIKYWINNFHWWKEYFGIEIAYGMTILEVRNEDWTLENIQDLITFCDYMVDETFKSLNNNKEEMFKYIFNIDIGIICVPKNVAQEVCDILVANGVKVIWNFAPMVLKVPKNILVQNENLAYSLSVVSSVIKENN